VLTGKASDVLDKYLTSAGFTWSIRDGQLQILAKDATTFESVVVLNSASGLIGSPEKGKEGYITFTSLLDGRLNPGSRVIINSLQVNGVYRIESVNHVGDTWGSDWYSECEAKPL
jgi:hypothetical protein